MNDPPSVMRRCVTATLSTPTPMSTGSWASCVIQLVVIALRSSPARDPTRASAFGIFQVTVFSSSSLKAMASRLRASDHASVRNATRSGRAAGSCTKNAWPPS